jgi:iron complex outermembrane receptor protein
MQRIKTTKIVLAAVLLCFTSALSAQIDEFGADDAARIDALLDLDIEALGEVEVKLDDVFDVFDGLLKRQTVKVASGVAQDASTAPAVTTVITAQDLEATGARTLTEALEAVPGMNVSRDFFYYTPIYNIRGINEDFNPQVLIMINNVPLKDLHAGNPTLRGINIPVYKVQRVEVMRGPGSAVHGADALAGIINIITKTASDIDGTEVGVRGGSFGQADIWALYGGTHKGFDIAAMFRYGSEDGHDEILEKDFQSFMDQRFNLDPPISHAPGPLALQRDNLDLRLDISRMTRDDATWRLQLSNQAVINAGPATGPGQALDYSGTADARISDVILSWSQPNLTEHWSMDARVVYTDRMWRYDNIAVYPPGAFINGRVYPDGFNADASGYERDGRLDLSAVYTGWKNHAWRFGSGYFYGDQYHTTQVVNWMSVTTMVDISDTPAIYNPERIRQSHYFFAQDAWRFADNWEFTGGARYDKYSDFGKTVNLRGALVWQARSNLSAKLLYGEAFRAPSFQELYNANNPLAQGNPNLDAESIDTWELAFDYRPSDTMHWGLNLYTFTWQDAIQFLKSEATGNNPGQNPPRIAQNYQDDINGHGFEVEMRWKTSPRSSLMANYAWHKVEQRGRDKGNYPQQDAYLRFDWLFYSDWYLDTQLNWIAKRERTFGDKRPAIDDYTTVDLSIRYKKAKDSKWNVAFGVKNLFDESVFEPSPGPDNNGVQRIPYDLPMAGRNWFAELRYKF